MAIWRRIFLSSALLLFISACSAASETDIQTEIAKTEVYQQFLDDAATATQKAMVTDTPEPSLTPTLPPPTNTPAPTVPPYCNINPNPYLEEVDRIYEEIQNTIDYWNASARGEAELLEVEIRIRSLLEQTEELNPPEDYEQVQEHFLAGVQGNLNAIFGITDQSDSNREGSNRSFQEEFQLAWFAWDDANENRERVCE
jgi:hypothetical protein